MAICNTFKRLTKETGTFLTFSQYMEDLTAWQTESKYHKLVPSKFVAIDCQSTDYNNATLPKLFQDYFENACACFKNGIYKNDDIDSMGVMSWTPENAKILFWNLMFDSGIIKLEEKAEKDEDETPETPGILGIQYVGDINLQSYNNVDGMGYSEIYCHIPNEASLYKYSVGTNDRDDMTIIKKSDDLIEGFLIGELNGSEKLKIQFGDFDKQELVYTIDKDYIFSWDDNDILTTKLQDKSFNINMIVVLYDIWNDNEAIVQGVPMGVYITGLIDDNGKIQNSITKYVSNEDIYNSGTSYGLRICSRYVVSSEQDNYVVKEVTCEDNNYGDLSRVLSQLSISQNKMDKIVNKTYNTEQNYKNLLAIFKNSKTNVPYIKIVNNESCWFVNGKLVGPSTADGLYDAYTSDEIDALLDSNLNQSFQIIASAQDINGKYIFEKNGGAVDIIVKWDVYYEGRKVNPNQVIVNNVDLTGCNQIVKQNVTESQEFVITAQYGQLISSTTVMVYFVHPIYFGEIPCVDSYEESNYHDSFKPTEAQIKMLTKYISNTQEHSFEITSNNPSDPGHICYAYPAELGHLKSITDLEGYVYYTISTNNQEPVENRYMMYGDNKDDKFMITPHNSPVAVPYYVYVDRTPVYQYKQILKFKKQPTMLDV